VVKAADGSVVLGDGLQQVVGGGAVTQRVQRGLVGGVAERGDEPQPQMIGSDSVNPTWWPPQSVNSSGAAQMLSFRASVRLLPAPSWGALTDRSSAQSGRYGESGSAQPSGLSAWRALWGLVGQSISDSSTAWVRVRAAPVAQMRAERMGSTAARASAKTRSTRWRSWLLSGSAVSAR
jgi:hypothetical protein